jgi:hypothetical protein
MPYTCYRATCAGITIAEIITRLKPAGITANQVGIEGRLFRLSTRHGSSTLLVCVNNRGRLYAITNDPAHEGSPQPILDAIRKAFKIETIEKLKLKETNEFFIMGNI